MNFFIENWYIFLPVISFLVMLLIWYKYGHDPQGSKIIVPYYKIPEGLTPIQASLIVHGEVKARDIAATLIFLAVENHIQIEEIEKGGKKDFMIKKLEETAYHPSGAESVLYSALFADDDQVLLSDMERLFDKVIPSMVMLANRAVVKRGYFEERPHRMQRATIIVGVNLFIFSAIFVFLGYGMGGVASLLISFVIITLFSILMPKLTKKGVNKKEEILGFKLYLEVAEKERITFHGQSKDADDAVIKKYEHFLPYAIALGVEDRILHIIDKKCDHFPRWFHGIESVSAHGILLGITKFDQIIARMFVI